MNRETIYRQDVLDLAKKGVLISNGSYKSVCKAINEIPPVNPQLCEDAISRQAVQDYVAKYLSQYLYNDVREAVEVIDEYIGELPSVNPTKTRWIPVSERLPEIDVPVLVHQTYYKGNAITIGRYHSDEEQGGYKYWQWIMYDSWFSYGIEHFGIICPNSDYVEAWMPLPKPYEPQERSE